MKIALPLVAIVLSTAAAPAVATPYVLSYSHSMQATGTSELGMPPFTDHRDRHLSCADPIIGDLACGGRNGRD